MNLPSFWRQRSRVTHEGAISGGSFLLMFVVLHLAFAKMIAGQRVIPLVVMFFLIGYTVLIPLPSKFILLILAALLPISFGDLGRIDTFLWVEWMGPMVFGIMTYNVLTERKHLIPPKCWLVVSSILVIVIWALINYCQHPVLAAKLMGVPEQKGGLRSYYTIFVGVCVFFSGLWLARYKVETENFWEQVLWIMVMVSCCLGVLRVLSYFLEFDIPFVYGVFRYARSFNPLQYGGEAFRIGGLSEAAKIGLAALLGLKIRKPFTVPDIILFCLFGLILFLSGGRTATLGVLAALGAYSTIFARKKFGWILGAGLLLICIVSFLLTWEIFSGQLDRLFALEGGFRIQDKYRFETFQQMWREFIDNPVLGKGVGYFGCGFDGVRSFAYGQLKVGGHGAYLSILSIFGLGGGFFLAVMLFGTILRGARLIAAKRMSDSVLSDRLVMIVFVVLVFIVQSFEYIAGGTGYKDMSLYLLAGILAGLYSAKTSPDG